MSDTDKNKLKGGFYMKSLFKKGLSILAAAMMFVLCTVPVFAAETATSATEMKDNYYTKTLGIADTPSLTIEKYVIGADGQADTTQPIQGVKFKYKKVGSLYQLKTTTDGEVMAYGISTDFATTLGINENADYTNGSNSYYKNGEVIQNAVKEKKAGDLITDDTFTVGTTDSDGKINANLDETNPWGLYLVVETDATGATIQEDNKDKPITVTGMQAPFIVSVPTYEGNAWKAQVIAKAKNSTGTADVEKKIVVGTNEAQTNGTEEVDDTDTTSIGDKVHFRLKGEILSIPEKGQDITQYMLTDQISKGLTPVKENETIKIDAVRIVGGDGITEGNITTLVDGDYTISAGSPITSTDAFNGGQEFTINIEQSGLQKLNQVAKNTGSTAREKAIYFYYSAVVNNDAVIGPGTGNSGNPNQVKLTYKVAGSSEMNTEWDKVTEYTFGLDVTKNLADASNEELAKITNVQFIVKDKTSGKYLTFAGSDGTYTNKTVAASDKGDATTLSPDANGKIEINGLVDGSYQLEEVKTVDGYNLLASPVEFTITAEKGKNTFVGDENNQYLGTLSTSDTTGVMSMTITNTKGFRLPSTGGPGTWLLVLGGAAIIVAGFVYNHKSSKQKPE